MDGSRSGHEQAGLCDGVLEDMGCLPKSVRLLQSLLADTHLMPC